MKCRIYRCKKKDEMYIYMPSETEPSEIPEAVTRISGVLEFAMELDITVDSKLARVQPADVLAAIEEQGFFIQMPPDLRPDLYFGD